MKLSLPLLFLVIGFYSATGQSADVLEAGRSYAGTLQPGQSHSYALAGSAGQYLQLSVISPKGYLGLTLTAPGGQILVPVIARAPQAQLVSFFPPVNGLYKLTFSLPSGRTEGEVYTVRLRRQEPVASTVEGRIDQVMDIYNRQDAPGTAVGIMRNGVLVYAKGYGMANLDNGIPFGPETISDIGSVSKQFTDFAIVLLAQQGKLSFDDDIRQHLTGIPDFGTPISIRHLIHHTSGLREIYEAFAIAGMRSGDAIYQEDALDLVRRSRELNFEPGSRYLYCNTAYMLLADIISKVGEQPFEDWMREHVFSPLGMNETYIMDKPGEWFPNCAASYSPDEAGVFVQVYDNSTVQGAGGVYTTVADLAKWLNNFRDPRVGGQPAVDQMLQRGILTDGDTLDYAFGLVHDTFRGMTRIGHTGSSAGYRAVISYLPDRDLAVILKSNRADFDRMRVLDNILTASLDLPAQVPEEEVGNSSAEPPKVLPALPLERLRQYAGRYFSPELEAFYTFWVQDGHLRGRHHRLPDFVLTPIGDDVFRGSQNFEEVRFERDAASGVSGLRVSNGRVMNLWMEKVE